MRLTLGQLEAEFAHLSVGPGGVSLLLPGDAAVRFIQRAEANGYRVVGLDAFHIRKRQVVVTSLPDGSQVTNGTELQPDLAHSIDYTVGSAARSGDYAQAASFVMEHAPFVSGFEVLLSTDDAPG